MWTRISYVPKICNFKKILFLAFFSFYFPFLLPLFFPPAPHPQRAANLRSSTFFFREIEQINPYRCSIFAFTIPDRHWSPPTSSVRRCRRRYYHRSARPIKVGCPQCCRTTCHHFPFLRCPKSEGYLCKDCVSIVGLAVVFSVFFLSLCC